MNTKRTAGGIAIIGMACRFPGANDVGTFWKNLQQGIESITHFTREDLLRAGVEASLLDDPNYVKASPVLEGVDRFDAGFFGYSTREAQLMDPQQRLLHEVGWEAFEDAGYHPETAEGPTGVFASAGGVVTSYLVANQHRTASFPGATGSMSHIGNDKDFLATRLSFKLNLTGPSLTVQTACSSSLVALHLACRSLASGEYRMALVAAATVRSPHKRGYLYHKGDILSPDGRCRAFDARAEGTVFGSGVAAVLLKDLAAALADGDQIYAVIKGTSINNDGAEKVSYTASSVAAQARAMVEALALSSVEPETIGFVECHGTGTAVGDPLEVQALSRAFRTFTSRTEFCAIGSVKTNIGHSEQTAGLAGLIKAVLAIRNGQIPPSLHYESPNPKIPFHKSPFFVNARLRDWEGRGGLRRAAVNALGLGGTNAFAVLEQAPNHAAPAAVDGERPVHLLSLSAKNDAALTVLASRVRDRIASNPELDLADVCFTANVSRSRMPVRLAVAARTSEQMTQRLELAAAGSDGTGLARGAGKRQPLAFLFTGQGSQYAGMAAQLYRAWSPFRQALDRCAELLRPQLERPLLDVVFADEGREIHETVYTQPALFAVEYALAELWRSFGVVPDAVMGHSVGEFVAACVAGVMRLEDAIKLIAFRGRLMHALPRGGSMVSVLADEAAVAHHIRRHGERVSTAAVNAPRSFVLSGEIETVGAIVRSLTAEGIVAKKLVVSHAFHSGLMDPILPQLEAVAREIEFTGARIPLVMNLTGLLADGPPTARYWTQHARGTVQFARGMETLAGLGCTAFLEIGPDSTLLGLGRQCLPHAGGPWLASLSRQRDDREEILESVGRLFAAGHAIDWKAVAGASARRRVSLPTYPFQHRSYQLDDDAPTLPALPRTEAADRHPLLGARMRSALKEVQFEASYGLSRLPFLDDHRIYGLPVLPTTAGLEAVIAGGIEILKTRDLELRNVVYSGAVLVPEDGSRIVQTIFTPEEDGVYGFRILSASEEDGGPWSSHITGTVAVRPLAPASADGLGVEDLLARQTEQIPVDRYYRVIGKFGLNYGPSFRGIQALWRGRGEAMSRVQMPEHLANSRFELHPAFLDACLHIYPALVEEYGDFSTAPDGLGPTFLPISLERVRFHQRGVKEAWVHAIRRTPLEKDSDTMTIDLRAIDGDGREVATLGGLLLKRLSPEQLRPAPADAIESWLYQVRWVKARPLAQPSETGCPPSRWLLFADRHGLAQALASQLERLGQKSDLVYQNRSGDEDAARAKIDAAVAPRLAPGHDYRGVVYLWGLDEGPLADMTLASLEHSEQAAVGGALALIRALSRAGQGTRQLPRLWLVTRNAQAAGGAAPVEPVQAMLWGLGRTAAFEHPKFWGGMIDLGVAGTADEAEALLREVWNPDEERQVAIRSEGRLVPRFVRLASGPAREGPLFREDASYLITGGLGSLGLKVAEWMADRGVRHLVLTSRRGIHAGAEEAVRVIQAKGTRVVVAAGDITREADLVRILGELRSTMPPLRGVFHCAGMLDDGILDQMDWGRFSAVTAPKVRGGWLLHCATLEDDLDYFVLFSSILSLFGSAGQSNYTSGNAFLDALTEHRRTAGRPAVALNWGPWAETGLATISGSRGEAIWKARGTRYIPPDGGIAVLEHILRRDVGHAGVAITDWRQFLGQFPAPVPFYEELEKEAGPRRRESGAGRDMQAFRDRIEAVQGRERRNLIVGFIQRETANLLGAEDTLDPGRPLGELGLDSLMSVSLANRLEPALGIPVPMAKLLTAPSILELVDTLFPGLNGEALRESEEKVPAGRQAVSVNGRNGGEAVRIDPDVVYGRRDGMALTFDIIRPARPNRAGVLWVQSGRWRSPWVNPNVWPVLAKPFLDRGLTVFVVRHGGAPRCNLLEIVEDVRLSVRFIRLKAGDFGIDSQRLGAYGSSAAGHLSLLLGTTGDDGDPHAREEALQQSSRVAAVVAIAPPTDLRGWVTDAPEEVKTITTRKEWRLYDAETAPDCSPLLHVSGKTAPTLLIHGDKDELVPINHSRAMMAELEKYNVAAKLLIVEGGGHVFDQKQNQDLVLPAALEWFDQQFADTKATIPENSIG